MKREKNLIWLQALDFTEAVQKLWWHDTQVIPNPQAGNGRLDCTPSSETTNQLQSEILKGRLDCLMGMESSRLGLGLGLGLG